MLPWRYLEGFGLKIQPDHDVLHRLMSLASVSGEVLPWHLCLAGFKFDVLHRTGHKQQAADALSWLLTNCHDTDRRLDALLAVRAKDANAMSKNPTLWMRRSMQLHKYSQLYGRVQLHQSHLPNLQPPGFSALVQGCSLSPIGVKKWN